MTLDVDALFSNETLRFEFSGQCGQIRIEKSIAPVPNIENVKFRVRLTIDGNILGSFIFSNKQHRDSFWEVVNKPFDFDGRELTNHYEVYLEDDPTIQQTLMKLINCLD